MDDDIIASSMISIERIGILTTEHKDKPTPHIVYRIEVATRNKVWTVDRRYSEFEQLYHQLIKKYDTQLRNKPAFPSKLLLGNFNHSSIEKRRKELENILHYFIQQNESAIMKDELMKEFLQYTQNDELDESSGEKKWLNEFKDIKESMKELKRETNTMILKRKINLISMRIGILGDQLMTLALSEVELLHRQDLLSYLRQDMKQLEEIMTSQDVATLSSVPSSSVNSANPTGMRTFSGRQFGIAHKQQMNDHQLLQLQNQVMKEQDGQVDELAQVIHRQKEMSYAIHNELQIHNALLDELDVAVDATNHSVKRTTKNISQFKKKA